MRANRTKHERRPRRPRQQPRRNPDLLAAVPAEIREVARLIRSHSPRVQANLVGGAVVDLIRGTTPKDFDIEVFGISWDNLLSIASSLGKANEVGKSFGIIKLVLPSGLDVDLSIPRRDSKTVGVTLDSDMSVSEAAKRRDFTINSLAMDLRTGEIIDPFGGRRDLEEGVLRATDEALFQDDPLRGLRAMQLLARKAKSIDPRTMQIIKGMKGEYGSLAQARVLEEWRKLLLKADKPSIGLDFLQESGWLELYPELAALVNLPQHPEWHPEGDVWVHTRQIADAAAKVRHLVPEEQREAFMFGTLLHDVGKATTTVTAEMVAKGEFPKERLLTSHGHDSVGRKPARAFTEKMGMSKKTTALTEELVGSHMKPYGLMAGNAKKGAYSRLARDLQLVGGDLTLLSRVCQCDACATGKVRGFTSAGEPDWDHQTSKNLLSWADEFGDTPQVPLVQGRDLMALGLKPGPGFTPLLNKALDMQEAGLSREDILTALQAEIVKKNPRSKSVSGVVPGFPGLFYTIGVDRNDQVEINLLEKRSPLDLKMEEVGYINAQPDYPHPKLRPSWMSISGVTRAYKVGGVEVDRRLQGKKLGVWLYEKLLSFLSVLHSTHIALTFNWPLSGYARAVRYSLSKRYESVCWEEDPQPGEHTESLPPVCIISSKLKHPSRRNPVRRIANLYALQQGLARDNAPRVVASSETTREVLSPPAGRDYAEVLANWYSVDFVPRYGEEKGWQKARAHAEKQVDTQLGLLGLLRQVVRPGATVVSVGAGFGDEAALAPEYKWVCLEYQKSLVSLASQRNTMMGLNAISKQWALFEGDVEQCQVECPQVLNRLGPIPRADALYAKHACGGITDGSIYQAVKLGVPVIVALTCCADRYPGLSHSVIAPHVPFAEYKALVKKSSKRGTPEGDAAITTIDGLREAFLEHNGYQVERGWLLDRYGKRKAAGSYIVARLRTRSNPRRR